jgi:hypothetical protein
MLPKSVKENEDEDINLHLYILKNVRSRTIHWEDAERLFEHCVSQLY